MNLDIPRYPLDKEPLDIWHARRDPTVPGQQGKLGRQALAQALEEANVVPGAHDQRIVEWLGEFELSTAVTVAAWILRAYEAGKATEPQPVQPEKSTIEDARVVTARRVLAEADTNPADEMSGQALRMALRMLLTIVDGQSLNDWIVHSAREQAALMPDAELGGDEVCVAADQRRTSPGRWVAASILCEAIHHHTPALLRVEGPGGWRPNDTSHDHWVPDQPVPDQPRTSPEVHDDHECGGCTCCNASECRTGAPISCNHLTCACWAG